jgi:hypothetical protein
MRKVWGKKRWAGFGTGTRAKRTLTNAAPSAEIMRYAAAAAAGEFTNKGAVIAGRILLSDQMRGDGFWDLAAIRTIAKRV